MFSRLAVVDVETTGLSPAMGHRVCEVGVVVVENGRVTEKFETLVNPRRHIDGMATLVHGLEDSDVKTAPTFSRVMPRLLRMLEGAVFVAHSAAFDHSFLEHEIRREHGRAYGFPSNVVCTKRFAWRKDYNDERPHGSLNGLTPSEFAARLTDPVPQLGLD